MIGFVVFRMSSVLRNTLFDPVTGRRPEGDVSAHEKRQLLVEATGGDRAQVTVDASGARRLTTARSRRGVLAAVALLAVWSLGRPAAAAGAPYYNLGLRWLGEAAVCQAPSGWTAARLLPALRGLPAALRDVCLYTWTAGVARPPSPRQVEELWRAAGASNMAEDVPVVHAMSSPEVMSTPEESFQTGLRGALTARVGGAGLLPTWPRYRAVRVVVIDTAPTSPHARIQLGASRHGDTLAHVIEDLVCQPLLCMDGCDAAELAARPCVSEVTTELALPWSARGIQGQRGGHVGTLADLARAIARALARWQAEGARHRLILNLSVGWEHTEQIAECSTAEPTSAPARAVRGLLQYAAAQGVLVVAAAGNDSAGPSPRVGLTCPGLYQTVPQAAHPSRALLIAASGVDYADQPLATARPGGRSGFAAPGLGGVAWIDGQPMPPQLVGSSVSTAVLSAVSALLWAADPALDAQEVAVNVYRGGDPVGPADSCPVSLPGCGSRRISTCGALLAAGVPTLCAPPPASGGSCPLLPGELAELAAAYAWVPPGTTVVQSPLLPATLPRYLAPSVQVQPSVFPMPVSATCPTCWVSSSNNSAPPSLTIPALGEPLGNAVLVLGLTDGSWHGVSLCNSTGSPPCLPPGTQLPPGTPYRFLIPSGWDVQSAYLTGIGALGYSVTEQIFVED